eukprot:scaffold803_cov310-Pinguiococcus_pyrenoidosus.AAC.103
MSPVQIRAMFSGASPVVLELVGFVRVDHSVVGVNPVKPGHISLQEFINYMREDLRSPLRANVSRRRLINFSHTAFAKVIESGEYKEMRRMKELNEGSSVRGETMVCDLCVGVLPHGANSCLGGVHDGGSGDPQARTNIRE